MLAHKLSFSSDYDESFFQELPASAAVFVLRGDGEPYVSKTANLRRRLQRILGPPTERSKRLNLRSVVRDIEFTATGSEFESQILLYRLLRDAFPKTYSARLRLRPAPVVKLHLENQYPRASVTTRLSSHGSNLFYGPFPSRAAAEKFASDALDFFKMRRCVDDLHPDPAFPGCVYSEMKMCLAPCFKGCTDEEYRAEVARVQAFFDTAGESLTRELGEQRDRASRELAFEEAAGVHAKIEKLKPVLSQLPEIVRRLDQLDAIIIQTSSDRDAVCLFRFEHAQIVGPVAFRIDSRGETPVVEGGSAHAAERKPRTMESRAEGVIAQLMQPSPAPAAACTEHLAILKRWYYRSQRTGEILFANEKGEWPLRRIVRAIGRVHKGEKEELLGFRTVPEPGLPS